MPRLPPLGERLERGRTRAAAFLSRLPHRRGKGAFALAASPLALAAGGIFLFGPSDPFAVRSIEVRGAPPALAKAVRRAAAPFASSSLVSLDGDALTRRIRRLPAIVDVRYDRAFPGTLRIFVRSERPAAVVRAGSKAWLVSARARVIRELRGPTLPPLPRVWLPSAVSLEAGETLLRAEGGTPARALGHLPDDFPVPVATARQTDHELTFVLADGIDLRLGDTRDIPVKLRAAAAVLASLTEIERSGLAYVDVSIPERSVTGQYAQLSSQG